MTIPTRDELSGYPCPWNEMSGWDCCHVACGGACVCAVLPVYRAHIALRKAVLGDMTGEEAAYTYRADARFYAGAGISAVAKLYGALADVVAKL